MIDLKSEKNVIYTFKLEYFIKSLQKDDLTARFLL